MGKFRRCDPPDGDQLSPISGIISPTRAYSLTGLTNYTWYTVTLNGRNVYQELFLDLQNIRGRDETFEPRNKVNE